MSHTTRIWAIVSLLLVVTLASCTSSPTPIHPTLALPTPTFLPPTPLPTAPKPPTPTSVPESPIWKLIPISVEVTEPDDGWMYSHVIFFLENQGNQWGIANVDTGPGTVETLEGFTYPVDPLTFSTNPVPIPPMFRIRNNILSFWFKFAESAHPTKVVFQNRETYDLKTIPMTKVRGELDFQTIKNLSFPTSRPNTDFQNIGDTIEIPNKGRVTFKQARQAGVSANSLSGAAPGLIIDVEFKNLNKGYDTKIMAQCRMFDGIGFIRRDIGFLGEGYDVTAGPGQTVQVQIGFAFMDTADSSWNIDNAKLANILNNAKLVCIGDFQTIINIDIQ